MRSGEKGVKQASAPPPLKCFFPSAGLILTVEMNILLIFTQHQIDTAVCPTSTLDFPLFFLILMFLTLFLSPSFSLSSSSSQHQDYQVQVPVEEYLTWEVQSTARLR